MLGRFSPVEPCSALPNTSWKPTHQLQSLHFRSRTEPIDWRRLAALDVDRVAREMDVGVLQDFITAVTFCAVEGERCPNCSGPADPSLIKLVRMSQLSTEYLLHCQDYLSAQLSGLEERLQGALSWAQQEERQRVELEKKNYENKLELRRRKKMLATQQHLLQASANNYHKCQFCEKSFVNYSYLQAHVQRRHPEITDAERQKKQQVEKMEDGIEELEKRLRKTQMELQAERETDGLRRQQEQEDQHRRQQLEKDALERWKEEERRQFQQEIGELRQLFIHESKDMANKSSSIEAKLLEMQNREFGPFTKDNLQEQWNNDKERRENRERKLKERMTQKLQSENARLLKALSVKQNSELSLSSQKPQDSPEDREEEYEESLEDSGHIIAEPLIENPGLLREFRTILKQSLKEKLENMGLRKGTKGISMQTFKNLSALLSGRLLQSSIEHPDLQNLRDTHAHEVIKRVKVLQKKQGKTAPSTFRNRGKTNSTQVKEIRPRSNKGSKPSTQRAKTQKSERFVPTPTQRSRAPTQIQTPPTRQKKTSTPPFSSEEDELVEDSAFITSSRGKQSLSVRLVQSGSLLNPIAEPDWSENELLEVSDTPKPHKTPSPHGSVVQTLKMSLERKLSTPTKKPVGWTGVLPPASSLSSRPAIVKQRALSDEWSDLELSSIEELTIPPAGERRSSEVVGTSGTSVWSSTASKAGEC
ncbi:Zinc finger protein DZIP1L DAZ-interacting protein 1-like protein [Triplophysa tibetana]|uniref:Zinc finger protein DZIP1L DAZ-interacting protein 1-like protein n=1 Tax=Triplophysa tibetana TaxID=1572043 RepID=A0A5A9NWK7_9TELE|nr:Zinc finger protein DZIP1L DAZ-interacting protein 1-like protein [Triplophysa tibetana]